VKYGASLGANTTLLPKITVGRWAMVGSGAVVTKDVPDYGLVVGSPARLVGFVCPCGHRLAAGEIVSEVMRARCTGCGTSIDIPLPTWRQIS